MILGALTDYYETLSNEGKLPKYGWTNKGISYAIDIDDEGQITQIISIKTLQRDAKSEKYVPQPIELPAEVKRTSGKKSNFLWDNAKYVLGITKKKKDKNAQTESGSEDQYETELCKEEFDACKKLHTEYLKDSVNPAAKALINFFNTWDVDNAEARLRSLCSDEDFKEIVEKANLTFTYDSRYICENQEIRDIWDSRFGSSSEDSDSDTGSQHESICLVTGEKITAQKTHPSIKMRGAQSSGAALVSFNSPAYCSYGKEQNLNAPVGSYAAYCYTAALNYLLADYENQAKIGDTTVIWWAEGGNEEYQDVFNFALFGNLDEQKYSANDLSSAIKDLCKGNAVMLDETRIDPNMKFYVLGLTPNNARISVRFFLENTFGSLLQNANDHQNRLKICHSKNDKFDSIPLWLLLNATVNGKERNPVASPNMAGDTLRSILSGTLYPATLLNGVMMRIRAEKDGGQADKERAEKEWVRAAIIKAYYLKNTNNDVPKEVLQVSLNKDSHNVPYVLGRLFSVLEEIQAKANPSINATIKDKYFNAASSTPAVVFPQLINLAQKHLKKLDQGPKIYLDKKLSQIMDLLDEEFPARLSLAEQGSFMLGYYHQTQDRYTPNNQKEEKQNG